MSGAAKCGRVRRWMSDAASGLLSESRRGEFEKHIGDCAACRAEFARVENLLGRIDESLRIGLAVEPSPKLVLSVRESIAAESQTVASPAGWLKRNSWLSAAGVCAAAAALLIFMVAHRANRPADNFATHPQVANSAPAPVSVPPSRGVSAENIPSRAFTAPSHGLSTENISPRAPAHSPVNKSHVALTRHESPRIRRRHSTEPEVIVQPGQMQAIFQFIAEMQKGEINGAEIEKGMHEAQKPLHIEPLKIAPLDASAGEASETPGARSREPGSSDGRSE